MHNPPGDSSLFSDEASLSGDIGSGHRSGKFGGRIQEGMVALNCDSDGSQICNLPRADQSRYSIRDLHKDCNGALPAK